MNFDNLYKIAKPENIKILLIGESPPAQEENFFYLAPNSDLYNFTKLTFENVFGDKIRKSTSFIKFFKSEGFFLDDLCREPINNIKDEYERETKRQHNIILLAQRIAEYNPIIIIGIMKKIKYHIAEAIRLSKIEPKYIHYLGYPTRNKTNISNYIDGLEDIIRSLIQEGILYY
ncbi:MAG: hypothetical protein HQ569_08605 [Actinobacteria bacterium]|nr:hypothetical protein [Actinomycetota bacterium]